MEIKVLKDEKLEDLTKEGLVIVDYFATWCGPCKMISPVLEDFAKNQKDIKVIKVDVDENREEASTANVMGVPTLVMLKDGQEIDRKSGYMNSQMLNDWVDQNK